MNNWPREEVELMLAKYQTEGPQGMHARMPHRTVKSIQMKAIALGLSQLDASRTKLDFTNNLPTTTLVEQLECVLLRKWRGPVGDTDAPLAPSLGRRAA